MRSIVWVLVLLAGCSNSAAPPPQQACTAVAQPWEAPRTSSSARDAVGAAQVRFGTDEAVRLSLHPDGEVAYLTLPQGEGEAASFGGLASFFIEEAGPYSVGLSEPIWIDVARGGRAADPVRFGPGSPCSGIRKAVTFDLAPGEYVLELSGSTVPDVGVLITPVP
jgi:hypothetical protein